MDIEEFRDFCLAQPLVTEDTAFGPDYLLFRIGGRIFACIGLVRPDYFVVKCDPVYAIELRERHAEIEGAWHWNKKHWNQVSLSGTLHDAFIRSLILHSYSLVASKLPMAFRHEHPELPTRPTK